MNHRLQRIEGLILSLTTVAAAAMFAVEGGHPLGVVVGGGAALVDFILIRMLVATALSHRPSPALAFPLALAKTALLVAIPATALVLPAGMIDGVSFAVGVTMLPVAIVADAMWPLPTVGEDGGTL